MTTGVPNVIDLSIIRLMVIEGSMLAMDGNALIESGGRTGFNFVPCTRWDEIYECVCAHIRLSGALRFPSSFRVRDASFRFPFLKVISTDICQLLYITASQ